MLISVEFARQQLHATLKHLTGVVANMRTLEVDDEDVARLVDRDLNSAKRATQQFIISDGLLREIEQRIQSQTLSLPDAQPVLNPLVAMCDEWLLVKGDESVYGL